MKIDNSVNFYNNSIGSNVESKTNETSSILERISALRGLSGVDGANLMISDELLNSELTSRQEISNSQNSIAMMQIADDTLSSLSNGASQIQELSVRANSDILNSDQKVMINSEVNAIKESMQDSINSTSFNGKSLNEFSSLNLENINISGLSADDLNTIEEFSKNINRMRSDIGANINELSSTINNKMDYVVESAKSRSNVDGSDLAKDIIDLNKEKLIEESKLFAQAQNINYIQKQAMFLLS